MAVTVLGINVFTQPTNSVLVVVFIIALQLSRESKTVLLLSTLIFERLEQLLKALLPINESELGIDSEVIFDPLSLKEVFGPHHLL